LGLFFSKLKRKPFILSTHGSLLGYKRYLEGRLSWLPYILYDLLTFKLTAKKADLVIVSSQVEYEDAIEFGIKEEKLKLVPGGVDIKRFEMASIKDRDSVTLLFVGRIARNRRIENMIRALKEINDRVRLMVVGSEEKTSSVSRGGYLEELIALAGKLGVEKRVQFVGPKFDDELVSFYSSADIFVYTSKYESFGHPILEAAAAGLPVISTPVGVAKELIRDGETGYLVEFDDPLMLVDKVEALLDGQVRNRCGKRIKELVKKNFAWDSIIDRYVNIYRELI